MKAAITFAVVATAIGLSATAASAQARGSYRATCDEIRQRGPVLEAVCETANGRLRQTAIDLRECRGGDIVNLNGRLACSGPPRGRAFRDQDDAFNPGYGRGRGRGYEVFEEPSVVRGPAYRY